MDKIVNRWFYPTILIEKHNSPLQFATFYIIAYSLFANVDTSLLPVQHLKLFGVPVPTYAVVRREYPNQELKYFVEQDDFIEIHGKRFYKPFVEKPIDGMLVSALDRKNIFLMVFPSTSSCLFFCLPLEYQLSFYICGIHVRQNKKKRKKKKTCTRSD